MQSVLYNIARYLGDCLYETTSYPLKPLDDFHTPLPPKTIEIPASLLPLLQLSSMAYQFCLHHEFAQDNKVRAFLFEHPLKIKPLLDSEYQQKYHNLSKMPYVKLGFDLGIYRDDWQDMMHFIMNKPFAGCWNLFIPMLTYSFHHGICPIQFYYHYLTHPAPEKVISVIWQHFHHPPPCKTLNFKQKILCPKDDFLQILLNKDCDLKKYPLEHFLEKAIK